MQLPSHVHYHQSPLKNGQIDGYANGKVIGVNITHATFDNDMRIYYEGAEFPQKLFTTPEALFAVGILKSIFIEAFKLRPTLGSLLSFFNRLAFKTLHSHLLKDEYRPLATRELDELLLNFLLAWGLNRIIASNFSKNFSHLFDFDNAYYLRLVDIMSETTQEKLLACPSKEMTRLARLSFSREHSQGDMKKVQMVIRALSLFLLLPRARRAWRHAIGKATISNMQYDNIDRYWACLREDYDFMGLSDTQRKQLLADQGYSLPTMREFKL